MHVLPRSSQSKPPSPARLTDRKHAAIVNAAVQEFQARGYYATSMNSIAAAANVSKRTLYNHFDSKESLFDAILESLANASAELSTCVFDEDRDLAEQLAELARVEIEFLTSPAVQALARAGLSRLVGEPEVGKKLNQRHFHKRVELWLRDAQEAGCLIELNTQFAAKQFMGLLSAFAFWPSICSGESIPGNTKRKRIIDETVTMFLNSYEA